jgi:Spy/CpxP family protein refolding chaperone
MAGGKWWLRPAIKDKLQLTLDQTEKINKIWIEHRKRIIDTKGEIEKTYLDLESLMDQPTVDKQEAYRLAERLGQLVAQQTEARIKMTIDIRQELSVEQFEKLKGLRAELAKGLREKRLKTEKR